MKSPILFYLLAALSSAEAQVDLSSILAQFSTLSLPTALSIPTALPTDLSLPTTLFLPTALPTELSLPTALPTASNPNHGPGLAKPTPMLPIISTSPITVGDIVATATSSIAAFGSALGQAGSIVTGFVSGTAGSFREAGCVGGKISVFGLGATLCGSVPFFAKRKGVGNHFLEGRDEGM